MKKFLPLIAGFVKGFIVFYIAFKLIKIMLQPLSNVIAVINCIIKKKSFSSKKEFNEEAFKDKYGLVSFLLWFLLYLSSFTLEMELPKLLSTLIPIFFIGLFLIFLFGIGIFFTPIPKMLRTNKHPKTTFINYLLPFIYYSSLIFVVLFISTQ